MITSRADGGLSDGPGHPVSTHEACNQFSNFTPQYCMPRQAVMCGRLSG
ncbi:hypothetical protein NEIELOOT_00043 [Neisseria elongata subsp. glycolytica ATCC 29315]|uniref:Uncharacterized protein n=1 Tax=Neisseria elongata subsp. glycolytica ATCC 29315 TaxID=546263 RepID=D4DLY2_NEIEG|nr:hypothetical protein NEIELOOT_00043 [Neisseria elongata subsp. glycolytica ATCC 29315]